MTDFFLETIRGPNLIATVLLGIATLYWAMMILGILGFDGLDGEIGIDADADLDAGIDGHIDGAIFSDVLTFFHLGEVPAVIIATFFVLFFWVATMCTNHYLNPDSTWLIAAYYLIPNILVSLLLTKFCVWPLSPLFREMRKTEAPRVVNSQGVVSTSYLNGEFGRVTIEQDGPPIVVNAITANGQRLPQHQPIKVIRFEPETALYIVQAIKPEKT